MDKSFEYFLKDAGFARAFARRDVDPAYAEMRCLLNPPLGKGFDRFSPTGN